jgi:DNA-directed RNA polymerase subunit RPC12/RpoP
MKCQNCGAEINTDQAMEARGQTVCEDCYIDMAAKPKTCDPWAVYSAKNLEKTGTGPDLTQNQSAIVDYLRTNGPTPPEKLAGDMGLTMDEFEREMAPLRHMEKVRAQLQEGEKVICLW